MENASKALIIAGAILLSILLISLGIMIMSQGQAAVEGSGMDKTQINTFNSDLQKYEGNKKGSLIRSMMNDLMALNNDDNNENQVAIKQADSVSHAITGFDDSKTSWINNTTTYKVTFGYDGSGRINTVYIGPKDVSPATVSGS